MKFVFGKAPLKASVTVTLIGRHTQNSPLRDECIARAVDGKSWAARVAKKETKSLVFYQSHPSQVGM